MTKTIKQLRILPPFAIGRLGSADEPMDNYTIDPAAATEEPEPLGYRKLKPLETLIVGDRSGEIEDVRTAALPLQFKANGRIRPVAPFLEVFAVTDDGDLEPLTVDLLKANGFSVKDVSWTVSVANRKVARRTGDEDDVVATGDVVISDHDIHPLHGRCNNFVRPKEDSVDFGHARFIKPNPTHPEIRLRFTPARGLIYGPKPDAADKRRDKLEANAEPHLRPYHIPDDRQIYGRKGTWKGFQSSPDRNNSAARKKIWKKNRWPLDFDNETVPPSLFAIDPPAPSWLFDNVAVSRGFFDDACDGFVEVRIAGPGEDPEKSPLKATARICSAPPAMVPDSLFVRSLDDDLEQVVFGPEVLAGESPEFTRGRALDIVRRAFETVRFMNVAVMNGNDYKGRPALALDSMPEEEAADTERAIRPIMHPGAADTKGVTALHQQAYAALRAGTAPWFARLLRRPDEVADFTDYGRRKMPALMCGADNNYLALTWRQIHTIEKCVTDPPSSAAAPAITNGLTPRNLSAQIRHEAKGNPISSRPIASVANCCPGLEVDFRAVWRRLFKGIELREYDNLVVREVDGEGSPGDGMDKTVKSLKGRRLLRVHVPVENGPPIPLPMTTPIKGPASSDPDGRIDLTTNQNPNGLAAVEWSNALAYVLPHAGQNLLCDFSEVSWDQQQPFVENKRKAVSVKLEVRPFFEDDTAVISKALAKAGELTQGLCSPWQNDYRECSCYYWASARPDFVNVEIGADGLSAGDNWMQRERAGSYVADDYSDSRLIMYDELFRDWEKALKFQIEGRDAPDSSGGEATGKKV
jgi:hypothetical protein